ncbi:hypothetical protein ABEV00_22100 [Paenibacillus thiaminolyticus]|uniref:hypothetical protein n=1 Tax=Paenibacillus thiaminolyticus TaxID=49283 RepID=UPI003D2C67ED
MTSVLLVILILVILFREEIRTIIGLGLLYILIVGLWDNNEWWGKPLVIALAILFALGVIVGLLGKYVEKYGETHFFQYVKVISQMLGILILVCSIAGGLYFLTKLIT